MARRTATLAARLHFISARRPLGTTWNKLRRRKKCVAENVGRTPLCRNSFWRGDTKCAYKAVFLVASGSRRIVSRRPASGDLPRFTEARSCACGGAWRRGPGGGGGAAVRRPRRGVRGAGVAVCAAARRDAETQLLNLRERASPPRAGGGGQTRRRLPVAAVHACSTIRVMVHPPSRINRRIQCLLRVQCPVSVCGHRPGERPQNFARRRCNHWPLSCCSRPSLHTDTPKVTARIAKTYILAVS